MAKRVSKSNTKAAKAAAGPTDDQKGSGVKAQTGAEKSASEPNTAEKRVVADTPPAVGANPEFVAGEIAKGADDEARAATPEEKAALLQAVEDLAGKSVSPIPEGLKIGPSANLQITVVGPKKGFRRAGRLFNKEPVTFGADEITTREFAALEAEPKLQVTLSEKPDATADD